MIIIFSAVGVQIITGPDSMRSGFCRLFTSDYFFAFHHA
jgi:hypothetical protein